MQNENKHMRTDPEKLGEATDPAQGVGIAEVETVVVVATPAEGPSGEAERAAEPWETEPAIPHNRSRTGRRGALSRTLSSERLGKAVHGLRDFGRRHPVSLFGGAVVAGLVAGLFARNRRNGAARRYRTDRHAVGDARERVSPQPATTVGAGRHVVARSPYSSRHL